jgi:hypothetical protein
LHARGAAGHLAKSKTPLMSDDRKGKPAQINAAPDASQHTAVAAHIPAKQRTAIADMRRKTLAISISASAPPQRWRQLSWSASESDFCEERRK